MTRLFCVMAVVVLGLMAVSVWAAVPYPPNCTVLWRSPAPSSDDSTKILCPQADADYLDVTVRDQFNTPMGSELVTVTFTDPLVILMAPPLTGVTSGSGYVRITIRAGINWAGPVNIITTCHVVVLGVEIYDRASNFLSPDYNGSGKVDASDFAFFADDWLRVGMKDCHSNFLRTPGTATENKVDAQDYSIFAGHWLDM